MLRKIWHTFSSAAANSGNRTKLALIVRADLKMSKGKTAAQCAHAAVLCCQRAQTPNGGNDKHAELLTSWLHEGQTKIVLRVEHYDELVALRERAQAAGVIGELVQDAGRTGGLSPGTATVLGLGPDNVEQIDKLVADLKLL